MKDRYTYFIGFKTVGRVEVIDLTKCPDFKGMPTDIRSIDTFTFQFANEEQLLAELKKRGLINGAGHLELYIRDNNSKGLSVREVLMGIAYRKDFAYLKRQDIFVFIKKNITNPIFLEAAIKFFTVYFGSKPMPDEKTMPYTEWQAEAAKRIHPLAHHIYSLKNYLFLLTYSPIDLKPSAFNKNRILLHDQALKGIEIMLSHLLYNKTADGQKTVSYRGLRDTAIFISHTDTLIKQKRKAEMDQRRTLQEMAMQDYEAAELAAVKDSTPPYQEYNRDYDEYLTPEEYAAMRGK